MRVEWCHAALCAADWLLPYDAVFKITLAASCCRASHTSQALLLQADMPSHLQSVPPSPAAAQPASAKPTQVEDHSACVLCCSVTLLWLCSISLSAEDHALH